MEKKEPPMFNSDPDDQSAIDPELGPDSTETIDLDNLITTDLTSTGSFDFIGVEATSLGKLLQSLPIPALLIDGAHTVIFANESCCNGTADGPTIKGSPVESLFPHPRHARKVKSLVGDVFRRRKQIVSQAVLNLDKGRLWGRVYFRPIKVSDKRLILLLVEDLSFEKRQLLLTRKHKLALERARDELEKRVEARVVDLSKANEQLRQEIAERKRAEETLKLASQIIESSNEAILITNVKGQTVQVNQAFCRITGYSRKEILGKGPSIFTSGHLDSRSYQEIWESLTRRGEWKGEVWDRRKNGEVYPRLLSLSAVKDDAGDVSHYVGIFSDITKIKQTEERLQRLAHYDPLTGLPNRILFHDRLQQALVQAKRRKRIVAIMLLDLDRFKNINDTLGHRFGDQVLVAVAERLTGCLRSTDTAARLGGDEFVAVLPEVSDTHGAAKVAGKIIEVLSKPFILDGREVFVTTSMGITVYPDDGAKVGRLLQNADTALYCAKEQGKNHFQFFSRAMNVSVLKRLNLEHTLRAAMSGNKLLLCYQPMVDLNTGRVVAAEALLRWRHPSLGAVSAGKLIPVAEETGLIIPIGEWVLHTACAQNKSWQKMGLPPMRVAVNISGRQLKQSNLVDNVLRILDQTDLDPKYLEMELTESVMMEEADSTISMLADLKRNGISVSVDDFGTGYSSLSYLRNFPVDKLKIDQSFLSEISSSHYEQEIVKAILAVAHSLQLEVIAEGVETNEQLRFLKNHGCDQAQGYYLCRPVPVNRLTKLMREDKITLPPIERE